MSDPSAVRGQVNAAAAEVYEAFFVPALFGQWCDPVLTASGVSAGDDVLDIGCGTGIVARAAAPRVGASGSVTGIDVNDGMLAVARRSPEPVVWQHAPAERLPFADASFDRVVCQFALMFFDDQHGALGEMARVVRPGGSVTIATWARVEDSPGYAAMIDLLRRLFGEHAAAALEAPFSLGTSDAILAIADGTLPGLSISRYDGTARFQSIEAWVRTDVRGWTLADLIDDDQHAELLAAAERELAFVACDDGTVEFAAPALIATA